MSVEKNINQNCSCAEVIYCIRILSIVPETALKKQFKSAAASVTAVTPFAAALFFKLTSKRPVMTSARPIYFARVISSPSTITPSNVENMTRDKSIIPYRLTDIFLSAHIANNHAALTAHAFTKEQKMKTGGVWKAPAENGIVKISPISV